MDSAELIVAIDVSRGEGSRKAVPLAQPVVEVDEFAAL
jgi:hypothetical protein